MRLNALHRTALLLQVQNELRNAKRRAKVWMEKEQWLMFVTFLQT